MPKCDNCGEAKARLNRGDENDLCKTCFDDINSSNGNNMETLSGDKPINELSVSQLTHLMTGIMKPMQEGIDSIKKEMTAK